MHRYLIHGSCTRCVSAVPNAVCWLLLVFTHVHCFGAVGNHYGVCACVCARVYTCECVCERGVALCSGGCCSAHGCLFLVFSTFGARNLHFHATPRVGEGVRSGDVFSLETGFPSHVSRVLPAVVSHPVFAWSQGWTRATNWWDVIKRFAHQPKQCPCPLDCTFKPRFICLYVNALIHCRLPAIFNMLWLFLFSTVYNQMHNRTNMNWDNLIKI